MERLRILLINPPQILPINSIPDATPPLGLAYLAAALEKDFEVRIIDCLLEGISKQKFISRELTMWGIDVDDLGRRISEFNPQIIGISCLYSGQDEMLHMIAAISKDRAKKENRNIFVVAGGPHASAGPKQMLRNKNIDYVIIGEGEFAFQQLCRVIQTGQSPESISGLAYRGAGGKLKANFPDQFAKHIDRIPFPARHLLNMTRYSSLNPYFRPRYRPSTNILLSRGCDNNCIFCSVPNNFGSCCRLRSPKNVMDEIREVVARFGIKEIYFEDDNLLRKIEYSRELCQRIIRADLDIAWSCTSGIVARGYNGHLLRDMKRSGCYSITLNLESGNDRVLWKIIKSPNDGDIAINLTKALKKSDIAVKANFRVGWPDESKEEMADTFRLAGNFKPDDISINTPIPFPGTPFWDKCLKQKLFAGPFKFKDFLLNQYFINSGQFTAESLPSIIEELSRDILGKSGRSGSDGLLGGILSRVANPFS